MEMRMQSSKEEMLRTGTKGPAVIECHSQGLMVGYSLTYSLITSLEIHVFLREMTNEKSLFSPYVSFSPESCPMGI